MEREIKFRGLRTDGKGFIYGSLAYFFNNKENIMIMPNCYFGTYDFGEEDEYESPIMSNEIALGGFVKVISESVGQFTGLKDNKGKEIYEGDVVKISNKPYKVNDSVVVWGKRSNGWSLKCEVIKDNSYDPEIKYYSLESGKHLKIIGNIHENPKLLK